MSERDDDIAGDEDADPPREVLSSLPRTRPQRPSARREAARAKPAPAARAKATAKGNAKPAARAKASGGARTPSGRGRKATPASPPGATTRAPAQGFESDTRGSVRPPTGGEVLGSAVEATTDLARAGVRAGGRLLRGALSLLSGR